MDLDETELATLRKQVKDKVCAIAISKKTEEVIKKVTEWLKNNSDPDPHEELPSMDLETTLTKISQPQASKENGRAPN